MPGSVAPISTRRRTLHMARITKRILVTFGVLTLATFPVLHAAGPQPATKRSATSYDQPDQRAPRPNLLIIGASSLTSPVGLTELVGAMLESKEIPMNIDGSYPRLDAVSEMLSPKKAWDFIILDAWHLGRTPADFGQGRANVPLDFPKALA